MEILTVRGLVKETYNGVSTSGQSQGIALTSGLAGGPRNLAEKSILAVNAAATMSGITRSQECLKRINRYANVATIAMVKAETVSVGIQNKNTLKSLFPSRLAAKNNAKSKIAGTQNSGENKFSKSPPTTAASPVAFVLVMPPKNHQEPTSSARISAASPLRMPLK